MKRSIWRKDDEVALAFADDIGARGLLRELCLQSYYKFYYRDCHGCMGQHVSQIIIRPKASLTSRTMLERLLLLARETYEVPVFIEIVDGFVPERRKPPKRKKRP